MIAMAATILGRQAFSILGKTPHLHQIAEEYPWDQILPVLAPIHAQDLIFRAERWPYLLRALLKATASKRYPLPRKRKSTS